MTKGIRGRYVPYIPDNTGFYSFDIIIDVYFTVKGSGFATAKESELHAIQIANELGIILESERYIGAPCPYDVNEQ